MEYVNPDRIHDECRCEPIAEHHGQVKERVIQKPSPNHGKVASAWRDFVFDLGVRLPDLDGTGIAGLSPEDQKRLDAINEMLDEEIRPYLQNDGGDLHVLGLAGNKLSVHYQGACGTCPSSISGTLRGIQNMLRSIEPEIEVEAM